MAASFLEEFLTMSLHRNLLMDEKISSPLFEMSGPLGTFSAKTRIAYAIGIVSKDVFADMNQIREVRNKFAHFLITSDDGIKVDAVTFSSREIRDRCTAMKFPESFESIAEYAGARKRGDWIAGMLKEELLSDPRRRFIGTCIGLAVALLWRDGRNPKPMLSY